MIGMRSPEKPPVLIFTDGACEEEGTSIGAVIWDPLGGCECLGAVVSEETVAKWRSKVGQKQVIGQAELFPVVVARLTWRSRVAGRRVLYFLDNESARLALVKAYSPVLASLEIVLQCVEFDAKEQCQSWYARVPTLSNIGDAPSRMRYSSELRELGAKIVEPIIPKGISLDRTMRMG